MANKKPGNRPFEPKRGPPRDRRRQQRNATADRDGGPDGPLTLYGLHAVAAALSNPDRAWSRLRATPNAATRLAALLDGPMPATETVTPRDLDRDLGKGVVHQGVCLDVGPLAPAPLETATAGNLVLVLDQVTDPHNVGAILRSAAAFGVNALVTTARHAAGETASLAKVASGGLERVPIVTVRNLAVAMEALGAAGFCRIGLAEGGGSSLDAVAPAAGPVALVLGAEGKGLRERTLSLCDHVVHLDLPGSFTTLNVSNAAAVGLYALTRNRRGS